MSKPRVHPTAIVEDGAELADDVEIGPYCIVGSRVTLRRGVRLISHVCVTGRTSIGEGTRVFPFASLGSEPQDLKYRGEDTALEIGAQCTIREAVTMNPGTAGGGGLTVVGDKGTFLASSHVAHDCKVGHSVILSNNVMLAGHVTIGNHVIIGGGVGVHQFVRIGQHAFIGGLSAVMHDVIPYGMALGNRAELAGLNIIGMKRLGFGRDGIQSLRHAYRLLFSDEGTLVERLADIENDEVARNPQVREILDFIKAHTDRALCMPRSG